MMLILLFGTVLILCSRYIHNIYVCTYITYIHGSKKPSALHNQAMEDNPINKVLERARYIVCIYYKLVWGKQNSGGTKPILYNVVVVNT